MVCAPVSDARVPCCVCRQVDIGAVDAHRKAKKMTMPASFWLEPQFQPPPCRLRRRRKRNGQFWPPGAPPAVAVLSPMYLSKYLSNVTSV